MGTGRRDNPDGTLSVLDCHRPDTSLNRPLLNRLIQIQDSDRFILNPDFCLGACNTFKTKKSSDGSNRKQ